MFIRFFMENEMLGKLLEKIFGSKHTRDAERLQPTVEEINRITEALADLSDDDLQAKTNYFRDIIRERVGSIREQINQLHDQLTQSDMDEKVDHEDIRKQIESLEEQENAGTESVLMEILPEAFAVVKETCRRLLGKTHKVLGHDVVWDMVPFDVQLMGGIILHEGKIAEMATGEGKTLVATLPLYLNALVGKGAHLVTVNDYLARRDAEWMGRIYEFLGLSVGVLDNTDPGTRQRKAAYECDITYGTNNEFGFDYLRDNMAGSPEMLVQRRHHYAIIDEVDSVLIDEARTPLIISGPVGESKNRFAEMKPKVERLVRDQTILVNRMVADGERLMGEEGKEYEAGIKLLQAQRGSPKHKKLIKLMHEPGIQRLIRRVESDFMRDKKLNELDEDLLFVIDEKAHICDLTDLGRQSLSPENPELFILPDLATQLSELEGDEAMDLATKEQRREALQAEYADKSEKLHNISQLLRAYSLFEKDVEYVVTDDGKVMIVDEFTGRLMPGRIYSDGLHQALEAKENVRIERETQTLATITLQNFFRLYTKLAGMTGTAETEAGEFWEIYKLDVTVIPTNEPVRRHDQDDVVYRTKREKYNAIIDEIVECHEKGIPVLVGTITVEVSETLSRMLRRRNIRHSVLNAKYHEQEAEIVARAGEPGMVTIATNMAGRGTDIKLGAGVIRFSDDYLQELVSEAGQFFNQGKLVLIHEVPALEADRFVHAFSAEGPPVRMISDKEEKKTFLNSLSKTKDPGIVLIRQAISGSTDSRIEMNHVVHIKARDFAEGGLFILGTERHESRRIDRQLRGRSGRQGDPGASRFYLSLEDDLMRLFGSERMAAIMDRMGLEEGEVITHPMITRSIERAQKKVENRNFEIRKHLLEYDNVMNKQREVIYARRRRALDGESLREDIQEMMADFIDESISMHLGTGDFHSGWNVDEFRENMLKTMLLPLPFDDEEWPSLNDNDVMERVREAAFLAYDEKRRALGDDLMSHLERFAVLKTIDEKWKEHLYEMDQLREGIGLRAYGQKDPLLEYKQEAFHAFSEMLGRINQDIIEIVFKAQLQAQQGPSTWEEKQTRAPAALEMATVHEEATGMGFASESPQAMESQGGGQPAAQRKQQPVRVEKKVGRNDPCPCGSGKKYKHCHGR